MVVAPSILVRYLVPAQYGAIRLSFFSQLKPMVNNNIVLVTHLLTVFSLDIYLVRVQIYISDEEDISGHGYGSRPKHECLEA